MSRLLIRSLEQFIVEGAIKVTTAAGHQYRQVSGKGGLMVFQIQLAKRIDAVPLTRDYIAHRDKALRSQETRRPVTRAAAELSTAASCGWPQQMEV